jgi:hypothetical protein
MDLHFFAQISISGQASDFADNAIAASQAIQAAIDTLWTSVQQGGTYKGLCKIGAQLAIATMIFFIFGWYKKVLEDGSFSWAPVTDFIWPLCIIALLVTSPGNPDGARLWAFTTGIRSAINNADQTVLTSVSSTANLAKSRAQAGQNVAFDSMIKSIATACNGKATPADKKACWDKNRAQVSQLINSQPNGQQSNPWLDGLMKTFDFAYTAATDPGQATVDALTAAAQLYENAFASVIKGLVLAFGMAFTYLLQLALLLTAMLGPIAVGASLLPLPTKPILAWVTAMFSIGIAQISFDIVTGLMSDVMLNAPPTDAMAYIIFTGILSPILALALASGGGLAVFSGLSAGAGAAIGGLAFANNAARQQRAEIAKSRQRRRPQTA